MTDWIKKHPKAVTKDDLLGEALMISESHAPVETNITGIKELTVFNHKNTAISYTILVTAQDINKMIEAYEKKVPFTFKLVEGQQYPQVHYIE